MDRYKLQYFMRINQKSAADISLQLDINETTFYRKLNGSSDFTRSEMIQIKDYLQLTEEDFLSVFFN